MRRFVMVAVLAATAIGPPAAAADVTVHVSTVKDPSGKDGMCSLREAVEYAGGSSRPDCSQAAPSGVVTISVPPGCYRLIAPLVLGSVAGANRVVITGAGAGPAACDGGGTVIDAQHTGTVIFNVSPNPVELSGVTLTGGLSCSNASISCNGGGVFNDGSLTLDEVTITGNASAAGTDRLVPGSGLVGGAGHDGGGIYNLLTSTLTVRRSLIVANAAGDGGAGADGSGNAGADGGRGGLGGGVANGGGTVDLIDSTIAGNTAGAGGTGGLGDPGANPATQGGNGGAGGSGGGIANVDVGLIGLPDSLTATNVTVTGNSAGSSGGGGQGNPAGGPGGPGVGGGVTNEGKAILVNGTVAANSANGFGDGVDGPSGSMATFGSIIAENGSGPNAHNCLGSIINNGDNVTYPAQVASDCPGAVADPKLGTLGLHGGSVPTIALGAGSAAIDAEPASAPCPVSDERGVPRPQGTACDAGAYETAPPTVVNVRTIPTGAGGAFVTTDVDPHLQDTGVVVRYGTSTAYGSATRSVDVGSGAGPAHVSVPLTGLYASTTYHLEVVATNPDGTTTSTDSSLTTASAGPGGGTRPVVTNLRQSTRRWRAGRALATISRRRSLPTGTTFSFDLDEVASVSLRFTQRLSGRLVKGRCTPPSRALRRRPKCALGVPAGRLAFRGHRGMNRIRFFGRLSRTARLTTGDYTVAIVAVSSAGQASQPRQLAFTIVR